MKISAIVFSKNRAMQLDALLRSILVYASHTFTDITVLWTATDEQFIKAYDAYEYCIKMTTGVFVNMVRQASSNFDLAVRSVVRAAVGDYVCFFVDDDIFYRAHKPLPLKLPEEYVCYSFRLGKNTTYCYPLERFQAEGECDFAYPFSLDGHVFRYGEIRTAIDNMSFCNPNEMEDALAACKTDRKILYSGHSSLVNIPHNIVSSYNNRSMNGEAKKLNDMFLDGYRINFEAMDFSNVTAAHQEIPFEFFKLA